MKQNSVFLKRMKKNPFIAFDTTNKKEHIHIKYCSANMFGPSMDLITLTILIDINKHKNIHKIIIKCK